MERVGLFLLGVLGLGLAPAWGPAAEDHPKPYSSPCVERENVFEFTEKPALKKMGEDRYEISFAVKGNCDVTVGILDEKGAVVRHLGSGVLGSNAPAPFQKNSLRQTLYWDGKDDLDAYPKNPEGFRVRVALGLNPTFDKRLGGSSPKNLPGQVWGIALDPSGAYLFIKGWHLTLRKFDRDGNYLKTLFPPPQNAPLEDYPGTGYIEYEPGKRAWHGLNIHESFAVNGMIFPIAVDYKSTFNCQVALAGKRLLFLNGGSSADSNIASSALYWIHTDGTTDLRGMQGQPFAWGAHRCPRLTASPDGKWVYMLCSDGGKYFFDPVVTRAPADGSAKATVFVGERGKVGSDDVHLNGPMGLDCDAQGRLYVSDQNNNRVQMFSPEGKFLKSFAVDRPHLLRVHQKSGAIYIQHSARIQGQSIARLTKFVSFEQPQEDFHIDHVATTAMAVDSWSANPRLWLAGAPKGGGKDGLVIYEEQDRKLKVIADFDEEARKEAGSNYFGRWSGNVFDKVVCDPLREQVYYKNRLIFDLATGARKPGALRHPGTTDDLAFDKRGYLHAHFNPCFFMQGVGRFDPAQAAAFKDWSGKVHQDALVYPECPYDYGIESGNLRGILPVKDQNGAKGFQDGLGVNMRGDLAVESNIYHVPRMEEEGWSFAAQAITASAKRGEYVDGSRGGAYNNFASYSKMIQDKQKRGEDVYFIPRVPGIPLAGATIWTYDATGELRHECAGTIGQLLAGVQMDLGGFLYFSTNRMKLYGNRQFLAGQGRTIGSPEARSNPYVSTLLKTKGQVKVLMAKSPIPLDPLPARPADLLDNGNSPLDGDGSGGTRCWVEGAEWFYAGAGPMVGAVCSCPSSRSGLDWYRRVFTSEAYRHSLAALDTNGNLILHIGQYANFDGGEGIGVMHSRFVSATDNYLVFDDWGERLVVLKLNYHAEESVPVKAR